MTQTLSVEERLVLLSILKPMEGSIVTLRLIRGLMERLGITSDEALALGLVEDGGKVTFKAGVVAPKDFEFAPAEAGILRSALSRLSDQGKLAMHHIGVFEKFVEGESA